MKVALEELVAHVRTWISRLPCVLEMQVLLSEDVFKGLQQRMATIFLAGHVLARGIGNN